MPPAILGADVHLAEQGVVAVQQVGDRAVRFLRPRNVPAQKVEALSAGVGEGGARDLAQPRVRQQRSPLLSVSEVGLEGGAEVGRFDHGLEDERVEAVLDVQKHPDFVRVAIVFPNHNVTPGTQHAVDFLEEGFDVRNVVEDHVNRDEVEAVRAVGKRDSVVMLEHETLALVLFGRQVAHVAAENVVPIQMQVLPDGDCNAAVSTADIEIIANAVRRKTRIRQHRVELE